MTPAQKVEKAFNDAHVVIADYLEPGVRNPEKTIEQLIQIIDNRELYDALLQLLLADGQDVTLAPAY
jgi:hypothetical protein